MKTILAMASVLLMAAAAQGQGEYKPPAPLPPPEIAADARPYLLQELEATKALRSIKGKTTQLWEIVTDERTYPPQTFTTEYSVAKPDKLFMENRDFKIWSDGKTLTVLNKFLQHYVQQAAPAPSELRETIERITEGQVRDIPGEALLNPGLTLEQTLRRVATVEHVRQGEFEGKPGVYITGTMIQDHEAGNPRYEFERFYSDEDHFVHHQVQDMREMDQRAVDKLAEEAKLDGGPEKEQKAVTYSKAGWTIEYERELNPDIPPFTFDFKPEKQVDKFVFMRPNLKEQVAMIGRPCPPVIGKDFDGKTIDLANYRGKVVVMDFWAIWCHYCVAGLPSMQMIKGKYADKLQLLGPNWDPAGSGDRVKKYLARRQLDIQQIDDSAKKIGDLFHVVGIPCVVIVDQKGIVADIDVGYLPGKETELMAKLDKLLAGQPIHTPEEIAALRMQVGVPDSN